MQKPDQNKKPSLQPSKPPLQLKLNTQTPLDYYNSTSNISKDIISQNLNLSQNKGSDSKNDTNNSFSLYDAQSSFYQNMNVSQSKSGNNNIQLPKEYFNCAFFTRKMSSKSSDVDKRKCQKSYNSFFFPLSSFSLPKKH